MKQAPLALPVCPYCGQHFSYKEVMKSKGQEDVQCPKCKQNFKVMMEMSFSILIAVVIIISFLYMAGVLLAGIIAIVAMIPLVIRYVKPENAKYSTRTTRQKK